MWIAISVLWLVAMIVVVALMYASGDAQRDVDRWIEDEF